jgi:hypothetical protein
VGAHFIADWTGNESRQTCQPRRSCNCMIEC